MAGYELQGSRILRKQLGCALGAILMVDPMKPITTNPLPEPFVRTRIHSRCLWQATVKAGVEDCHLENVTHTFLDDFNPVQDRKSTRLNSSHVAISYAVFCLKNKHELYAFGPPWR